MTRMPVGGALTVGYEGRIHELHYEAHIRATLATTEPIGFDGLWDTGATNTVVTKEVVDALGLVQTGVKDVYTPQGHHITPSYIVDICFPGSKLEFNSIEVTLGVLGNCKVLIGMDIICFGDFSVTNKDGLTVMSFRVPSSQKIDYVQRMNDDEKRFASLSKTKQRKLRTR